ncbi:MAG TPA: hypothetical protein VGT82_11145, partial [Ktedonobacteraceae bacterium]|nr:hypothetical protein [Ktedonobacteraceae bacterium]
TNGNNFFSYSNHTKIVTDVAWSPDSKYIVTGDYNSDDSVRIWSVSQKSYQQLFKGTSNQQIYAVSWWPNDKYIAAGGQDEKVKVRDATTEKLVLIYTGHNQPIMSVQWSHDGKSIASSSFDKTVQIWTVR